MAGGRELLAGDLGDEPGRGFDADPRHAGQDRFQRVRGDELLDLDGDFSALACQWPIRTARRRPAEMPAGGHGNCPFMANRSAHQGGGGVGHEAAALD